MPQFCDLKENRIRSRIVFKPLFDQSSRFAKPIPGIIVLHIEPDARRDHDGRRAQARPNDRSRVRPRRLPALLPRRPGVQEGDLSRVRLSARSSRMTGSAMKTIAFWAYPAILLAAWLGLAGWTLSAAATIQPSLQSIAAASCRGSANGNRQLHVADAGHLFRLD